MRKHSSVTPQLLSMLSQIDPSDLVSFLSHTAGIGAASHLAANATYGGLRAAANAAHTSAPTGIFSRLRNHIGKKWHRNEEKEFARGVQLALQGQPPHAGQRFIETLLGPEAYAARGEGRLLGNTLRDIPTDAGRDKALGNLQRGLAELVAERPELATTPIVGPMYRGVARARDLDLRVGDIRPESRLSRVTPALVTAGLGVVDPPAAAHGVLNTIRSRLPETPVGKNFALNDLRAGTARSLDGWVHPHPRWQAFKDRATDVLLSPMARDGGRFAERVGTAIKAAPEAAAKLTYGLQQAVQSSPALKTRLNAGGFSIPDSAAALQTRALAYGRNTERAMEQLAPVPGYQQWRGLVRARVANNIAEPLTHARDMHTIYNMLPNRQTTPSNTL